ncbi:sensor histidine kinase [Streptomyces abikoensis]|uniref:histidine kinase n=1 Tax=Streptomyces abikoensis TaxID=97398 RepID=A0ABW7T4W4_9ACTN
MDDELLRAGVRGAVPPWGDVVAIVGIAALALLAAVTSAVALGLTVVYDVVGRLPTAEAFPRNPLLSVCLAAAGLLILRRDCRHGVGWVLLIVGVAFGDIGLVGVLRNLHYLHVPAGDVFTFRFEKILNQASIYAKDGGLVLLPLWLPAGRLASRFSQITVAAVFTVYAAYLTLYVTYCLHAPTPDWDPHDHHPLWDHLGELVIWMSRTLSVVITVRLALRIRHSSGLMRRQLGVLGVFLVCYAVYWGVMITDMVGQEIGNFSNPTWLDFATGGPTALGLALMPASALARDDLTRRDRMLGRLLVTVGLGLGLLASYCALFAVGQTVYHGTPATSAAFAAALSVLALRPLAAFLWRAVDWLFYGRRAGPYQAVRALAGRLRERSGADEIAVSVCHTVVEQLGLPMAVLKANTRNGPRSLACVGDPAHTAVQCDLSLQHHGEIVGELAVACRPGYTELDARDRSVLEALSYQVAPVVAALRLREDLRASRERVVTAREEERRRLRRDLHDGMGPALAGIRLRLETAALRLGPDSAAKELIGQAVEQTAATLRDVRRITDDLRPSEVDDLGLSAALEQLASRLSSPQTHIAITVPRQLPSLPAATEVAAYRIAAEALTNVIKHAQADRAELRMRAAGTWLELDVVDNGAGIALPGRAPGIGCRSMTERAEEIGGHCTIAPAPAGGTAVRVRLPSQLP